MLYVSITQKKKEKKNNNYLDYKNKNKDNNYTTIINRSYLSHMVIDIGDCLGEDKKLNEKERNSLKMLRLLILL